MAFWIPFMMAASTAVTIMGQQQQKKNMKADAAWKKYETDLNFHVNKQKELTNQTRLLSEQRARGGASGAQFGGSSLLLQHGSIDSKLAGQMSSANLNMLGTAVQGGTSILSYNKQQKFLDQQYGPVDDG